MTENTTRASTDDSIDAADDPLDVSDAASPDESGSRDPVRVAAWIGLATAVLVGVVALYRFYAHATETIVALVPPDYVDPFLAGFNLALLLVAGAASLVLVRVLAGDVEVF